MSDYKAWAGPPSDMGWYRCHGCEASFDDWGMGTHRATCPKVCVREECEWHKELEDEVTERVEVELTVNGTGELGSTAVRRALEDAFPTVHFKIVGKTKKEGTPEFWRTCSPAASIPMTNGDPQWSNRFKTALHDVNYKDGYGLVLKKDLTVTGQQGRWYFQVECLRPDTRDGTMGVGKSGKMWLSPHMAMNEILQGVFRLFAGYEEHEAREFFTFQGVALYNPHIDVAAQMKAAKELKYRD